jgi:hypothetical protein
MDDGTDAWKGRPPLDRCLEVNVPNEIKNFSYNWDQKNFCSKSANTQHGSPNEFYKVIFSL